jgi:hypothetical protein
MFICKTLKITLLLISFTTLESSAKDTDLLKAADFNKERDLLLVQFDCKTDVDDLQTAAALVTLLADAEFSNIKYHAVAGTYGIQDGLYVPPNTLFQRAFGDNWTDAHDNLDIAVEKVSGIVASTIANNGDVWIAEAGQSDFTARVVKAVEAECPDISVLQRIHVVQHSEWNENVTSPESLQYVKNNTDYYKIPDGNAEGNGTPGFRSPGYTQWKSEMSDPELTAVWQLAVDLSNEYNGKEGRYNNQAISAGGLDFSDLAEVCWILGIQDI